MLGRHDIRPVLARPASRPAPAAAGAGMAAAVGLGAGGGEVLPPAETSGLHPPGGSIPTGADGGAPGVDGGSHPDAGTGDGGSPGTDGGSATGGRFPASATIYQDVSRAPLDPSSPPILAHLAHPRWGTGAMQLDLRLHLLHAD